MVALLVGVALDRGAIKTVETPVLDLFPDYADLHTPDRNHITLRDLLTMRAGLRWVYKPYLSMARRMEAAPDPYRFVLDHGAWHGRQIVSAAWISEMTAPQVAMRSDSYGYFWWLDRATVNGRNLDLDDGYGWGGQLLCVVPSMDMVVVVTAGLYNYDGGGDQDLAGTTARDIALRAVLTN